MNASQVATTLLRKHEIGGNEHLAGTLICDKCGDTWRACSGIRERYLRESAAAPTPDMMIDAHMEELGICPGGSPTIAVGLNLYARKLCDAAINAQLEHDLAENEKQVREWLGFVRLSEQESGAGFEVNDYFDLLSSNRQAALLDLAHWDYLEPGSWPNFRGHLIDALTIGGPGCTFYADAARELLWKDGNDESKGRSGIYTLSKGHYPGDQRAEELAGIIGTNELPEGCE
jgi:hypothetical protein